MGVRLLLILGVAIFVLGLLFTFAGRMGVGRLPGDFAFRRGNVTVYFPLMTSIILSLVLTLILWLFRK